MFLHVYWLFCQTLHPAFQDRTEQTRCLLVNEEQNKQQRPGCGKQTILCDEWKRESGGTERDLRSCVLQLPWDQRRVTATANMAFLIFSSHTQSFN